MEGELVNPLIASATDITGGSTYSLAVNDGSPFVSSTFGTSRTSGWLNDRGLSKGPSLVRTWAASADESTFLQFDVRPDSGNFGKWGFYLQNTRAKLVSLFIRNGQFEVRGRTSLSSPSVYLAVPGVKVTAGQWYHVSIAIRPPSSSDRSYGISIKDISGQHGALATVYYDVDTRDAVTQLSVWPSGFSAASIHIDNVLITKIKDPEFRYGYFPSANLIRFYLVAPSSFTDWTLTLRAKANLSGSPLAAQSGKLPFPNSASELPIPTLADGDYDLALALTNPTTGARSDLVRTFTQKTPSWKNIKLGTNAIVVPPFTPLAVNSANGTVSCLLRSYQVGSTGLWSQVTSQGSPLLAAPTQLSVTSGGATSTAVGSGITYSRINAAQVTGTSRWTSSYVSGSTQVDYEYDGMMKVTLNIDPTAAPISDMSMIIPLQNSAMTTDARGLLMHAVTDGIRSNPVGRVPAGTGVVWNSTNIERNESVGPFVPYIWLGGPERGICWFADNDKDWMVDPAKPELEITRNGGQTSLVVHFINTPSSINRQRTIVFGLMATPAKAMPAQPSFRKWSFGPSGASGDHPFALMASAIGRGSLSRSSSFYPAFKNYSVYNELAQIRRTGFSNGASFLDPWMAQPSFSKPEFTAAWKSDYRTALENSLDDLSGQWRNNSVVQDLVQDGMEANRLNPLNVSTPSGSSYTFTSDHPSPFVSGQLGQSRQSGLLVNTSTTDRPALKREHFGASGANWLSAQFDFRPVSGRWDQWGFWIGSTELDTYAAALRIQNNAFWVYGSATAGGQYTGVPIPNISITPGNWYHVEFLISPTTNTTAEKVFSVKVTDSVGHVGVVPKLYFIKDFSAGVTRILFAGIDNNYQPGAIQLDNVLVSNVKPTAGLIYLNPAGMSWDPEVQTYLDEWSTFDVADPRWDFAVASGYRWLRENSAGYNSLTSLDYRARACRSYTDMLLYYCSKMLSSFAEGVYFDNLSMSPNYDPAVGSGYVDDNGRVHAGMGIFALRDLYKRLATMQYEMGRQPIICAHMTNAQLVPVLSFATMNYDLEWYGPGLAPAAAAVMDFQDRFNLDRDTAPLLAGSTGLQSGNPTFLVNYLYNPDPTNKLLHQHLLRTVLASCLVHEVRLPATDMPKTQARLQAFGYGERDAQVYHYWDANPPVSTSGAVVKTLVVSRPNKTLVVVGSFGPAGTAALTLDLARLKLPSTAQATDYETGTRLPQLSPGVFSVPIAKHDFKLVLIK
jgi:hypothetical protein